jgi:transposase-like protein
MDLARSRYSRDLKLSVMRAMDAGESGGRVARRMQISPKLIERWRAEWRARGEASFPGTGRRAGPKLPREERTVADLERKIGQLTLENDFLKKALQHFREHHPPAVVSGATVCAARSGTRAKAVRP